MSKLVFRAGQEAYQRIKENGFRPEMVKAVVAAAGGPKWFTIYGLTKYVLSDLLQNASHEIHFLGSSVGSWQMTAVLTSDPASAINRLQHAYSTSCYTAKPDEKEISNVCSEIIQSMLGDEHEHIIDHPTRHLHIITSRGKGLLSHQRNVTKGVGFALSYTTNALKRKWLSKSVERILFSSNHYLPYKPEEDLLPTKVFSLTKQNILPALRASGSIPFMMEAIRDIPGGLKGAYWDGGITDYHISLPYVVDGIVLQPHFLPFVVQGWFDKKLPWNRMASPTFMSKVLLVTPSESFIKSLPRGQISDMKDFKYFGPDQEARIRYWTEISDRSLELGQEFKEIVEGDDLLKVIQAY